MREDEQRMMRVMPSQSGSGDAFVNAVVAANNEAQQQMLALDRMRLLLIWSVGEASESVDTAGLKQENTAAGR